MDNSRVKDKGIIPASIINKQQIATIVHREKCERCKA